MDLEKRLFLIRHGETDYNKERRVQGGTLAGLPLNTEGRNGAKITGIALNRRFRFFGWRVITSSLLRTQETAKLIQEHLSGSTEITIANALREIDYGGWENKTYLEIKEKYPKEYEIWFKNPTDDFIFPGGKETIGQARKRIIECFEYHVKNWLFDLSPLNKDLLLTAHSIVNKMIILHTLKLPFTKWARLDQDNCCINILKFSYLFDGEVLFSPRITLNLLNHASHLP